MPHATDLNLTAKDVQGLTSADALAAFLAKLGYDTGRRQPLTAEAIGLAGEAAAPIKKIEVLAEDPEEFFRVVFVHLRSLTAKSRNDLARKLGRTNVDHLLILSSDFDTLELVLIDKRRRDARGPADQQKVQIVPLSLAIDRKAVGNREQKVLRRLTWTGRDGLEQFDKLRATFEAAAFSEDYFCNRTLFADHYLLTRLREDPAWRDNPTAAFQQVRELLADARGRWLNKGEQVVRSELYEPVFKLLGFEATKNKEAGEAHTEPDYLLTGPAGKTAAFVYAWDRWLDGPDFNLDQQTPEENPGACVVTALEEGLGEFGAVDWILMTNGRQWRLYSRQAHSRATNFYEVDLAEALVASGDTDPNEAFRYWWLFFRAAAFGPAAGQEQGCWLDAVAQGSRDYAKELGERLKDRIFKQIFPHLARGFLEDRRKRLDAKGKPSEVELHDLFEATLTLLYRLLFLLYAEARDLLPVREAPYRAASLMQLKQEIAERAGVAETEAAARIDKAYSGGETELYDRLQRLCQAMDRGDASLNVPIYNGGLFISRPDKSESREQRIARFLAEHKVPDRFLALAIDRLARDEDDKTLSLVPIDYKSLEVRHLGSIYEGLLEFKLIVAGEDKTTQRDKKGERYVPLSAAKAKRGKQVEVVVRKGDVYLSNDKAERKASGSYYTPDPIVEYIVEHTVGPVLDERLEALRPEFRQVRKTFDNEVQKATAFPVRSPSGDPVDAREFAAQKTYVAHKELVERLFEFRTLDPAMGSGHFLVEAVDFLTDRLLTFLNQFPVNPVSFMLSETRRNILSALAEQGVQVDPDKLTDVHLLKRHVLKRCIYGVDLNPMAVELAKVSLWLDAFTLGAPLSFLDHHLRCGNSLVGATFADLETTVKATKTQAASLFGIDYEPMLRAVRHVLHVNQMSDATAAEVKQSASEYQASRNDLAGYQIVLDLLAAEYFGLPQATRLLAMFGNQLDLSSRARFMQSLGDLEASGLESLAVVEKVSSFSNDPNHRFFHWEIEFPEAFFGFADREGRNLEHKSKIVPGSEGFDAVVGNPPYDVLEKDRLGDHQPHAAAETFIKQSPAYANALGGKVNLYRPFLIRSLGLLRSMGRYSQIVPMSLLADVSLSKTRVGMFAMCQPESFCAFPQKDDSRNRVFEDAKLSTCIPVLIRRNASMAATQLPFTVKSFKGKDFTHCQSNAVLSFSDLSLLDDKHCSIPLCSQEEFTLALRLHANGARLRDVVAISRGEINQTVYRKYITSIATHRPLLKGAEVRPFGLNNRMSQGVREYFDERTYESEHPKKRPPRVRLATQRITGVDERRRIVCAATENRCYYADSVNAIEALPGVSLRAVAALLNSDLLNWRFAITSTNNNVATNELELLPFPRALQDDAVQRLESLARQLEALDGSTAHSISESSAFAALNRLVYELFGVTRNEQAIVSARVHR